MSILIYPFVKIGVYRCHNTDIALLLMILKSNVSLSICPGADSRKKKTHNLFIIIMLIKNLQQDILITV